jgi:ribonuclease HIII
VRRQGRSRAFSPNQRSKARTTGRFPAERGFSFSIATVAEDKRSAYHDTKIVKPLTSYTRKLTPEQARALQRYLEQHDFKFRQVPYARFAGEKDKVNVVFYESGKLVLQGKGTPEFIEFVLEPEILREARLGYETVLNPDLLLPRLGVDESGKGDFFGPLCIAGVYVNESVVNAWQAAGIQDSKKVGSDRRIADLAEIIRKTPGCVYTVVPIGNEAYNRLYARMRSVNAILAWGHARVIENLLLLQYQMKPLPVRVISDQFAASKDTVAQALMGLGRKVELIQRHRAEEDLAVAAASILARHEFVTRLDKLGKQSDMTLPKGASAAVDAAAKTFVERHGPEELKKVAKMHFRTAFRAQGLPEPPKKKWSKA